MAPLSCNHHTVLLFAKNIFQTIEQRIKASGWIALPSFFVYKSDAFSTNLTLYGWLSSCTLFAQVLTGGKLACWIITNSSGLKAQPKQLHYNYKKERYSHVGSLPSAAGKCRSGCPKSITITMSTALILFYVISYDPPTQILLSLMWPFNLTHGFNYYYLWTFKEQLFRTAFMRLSNLL